MKKILKKIKRKIKSLKKKHEIKKIKNLNLKKICKITGLILPKEYKKISKTRISDVTLSSKYLTPNCIYFVLHQPKEDFEKIKENVLFVVTKTPIEGCNNIICDNPGYYGKKYFNYLRNLYNPKVIAVTGSIGKTSTKDMIASVLEQQYKDKMISSAGNSNSTNKVFNYIKKINENIKVYLQEVGAGSGAYDIVKNSAEIIEANIAIYTNIKDSHIEWYGSRENIAKEKFTLSDYGKKKGLAIINYDDEILKNHQFEQKTISYALENCEADVYAKNIKVTSSGTSFTIIDKKRKKKMNVELNVIGEQHVLNSLVAYIVGKKLKLDDFQIEKGLKNYKTKGSRQNLIDVGKYKVLADCYNSSYDALSFILKTFNLLETNQSGKKYAVIGDIFQLGELSNKIHADVGILLSKYDIEKVFFIGEKSKYSYDSYLKIKSNCFYTNNRQELIENIKKEIKENDIILFKASHGMYFAELIDEIFGTEIGEKSFIDHKEYSKTKDKNFICNLYENHASISKCLTKNKKIKIPEKMNNLPIKMINYAAFNQNQNIKEIILSENIVRICPICFKYSSLEKIKFNKELKSLGKGCFRFCENLNEAILPEGLLFIEYRAFANCPNLKKVYIPNSVKKIEPQVFYGSANVTIECHANSYALKYAQKRNLKYKIID